MHPSHSVFFATFYTSSLNLFLAGVDCNYWGDGVPALNAFDPPVICFEGTHNYVAAVALGMGVVFTLMAFLLVNVQVEWSPVTTDPVGMPISTLEPILFIYKTIMTCAAILLHK